MGRGIKKHINKGKQNTTRRGRWCEHMNVDYSEKYNVMVNVNPQAQNQNIEVIIVLSEYIIKQRNTTTNKA